MLMLSGLDWVCSGDLGEKGPKVAVIVYSGAKVKHWAVDAISDRERRGFICVASKYFIYGNNI